MAIALDLSLPLATLLREATKEAHEKAENSDGARVLLSGQLPKTQYIQFLFMLFQVYDTFERALDTHSLHPTLEPTYNPTLLSRTPSLISDISYLLSTSPSSWKSHPVYQQFIANPPKELTTYVSRIEEISTQGDPSALLAHSYVRYLGDLSGGQFIKRVIVKAYGLDENDGGTEFFDFEELSAKESGQGRKKAGQGDMKRIKEWFREGMNKGGERNDEVKAAVVNEANLAFELNTGLFSAVGDLFAQAQAEEEQKSLPLTERTFSFSTVATVIAAVCLAHFILVIGGFTGNNGYQKLLAVEDWLRASLSGSPSAE